ncbi:hydrolase 1, exosortase A system-associated [Nitrogeniibacter aestuarii]|uniref:hydrolase 1, exosortase A system-associated n=1 Tax=Nitrogeniibacter aestuarii TaxID=2815343 RepID=UPI001D0F51CC|nr:hydrolase 1, exosortase A system-associated [Nitrogeniibacter aestuarii]
MTDIASTFSCEGETLIAITSVPGAGEVPLQLGVLVVVGGPQYRVGAHRQFALLARALATEGIPCMRFDFRGMGDATGAPSSFDASDSDIAAAVDHFMAQLPGLDGVVLWGLCDGATAASLYGTRDDRIKGLVLLNPWVRSEAGHAKTMLKHYYLQRLVSPAFWRKLFSARVNPFASLMELLGTARKSRRADGPVDSPDTQKPWLERMREALSAPDMPILIVLSGRDYVANEFDELLQSDRGWRSCFERPNCTFERLTECDHTFSNAIARDQVAALTARWVTDRLQA